MSLNDGKGPMAGLTIHEYEAIRTVKNLLAKHPETMIRTLVGQGAPSCAEGLLSLGLSALLELSKQRLEIMKLVAVLGEIAKQEKEARDRDATKKNQATGIQGDKEGA